MSERGEKTHASHRGAWAELHAAAWLLGQGYEVFRNVSPHGPIDLIVADREGDVWLVDVKTRRNVQFYGGKRLLPLQQKLGVKLVFVDTDGTCTWGNDIFVDPPVDWPVVCPFCAGHSDDRQRCTSSSGLSRHVVARHGRSYNDAVLALIGGND